MQRQTGVSQFFFNPVDPVNPVQKGKRNRQDEQDLQDGLKHRSFCFVEWG